MILIKISSSRDFRVYFDYYAKIFLEHIKNKFSLIRMVRVSVNTRLFIYDLSE